MNYELSESHRSLQAEMGKFCAEEIAPGAALLDEAPPDEAAARMRVNLKALAGAGYQDLLLGETCSVHASPAKSWPGPAPRPFLRP